MRETESPQIENARRRRLKRGVVTPVPLVKRLIGPYEIRPPHPNDVLRPLKKRAA